ncbi:MAG: lasso peptide biosynthesis B2 protein [Acetatifactor sp.]|nr:lasso peptide biosynthesis B2 protein [Acetatifactor sp.]
MKINPYKFLRYNKHKMMTLRAYWYSAVFRIQILTVKMDKLHKRWGEEGRESSEKETDEVYRIAYRVAKEVNRICTKTSWESKCLVRALTAQKLLKKEGIHSTLYLGCAHDGEKMIAHAWLRCGEVYVTGGDGSGYAMVDKFYA